MFFYFYQALMVFSLVASSFVMVLMWPHRRFPGAKAMIALVAGTFVWTLGFLLEANSATLARQLLFTNIGYLGLMAVPVTWFLFALRYTNIGQGIRGRKIALLCVIPAVTTFLVWSNNLHHLMWSNEHLTTSGAFLVTAKTYGPFFWVAMASNYILILTGAAILIRRLFIGTPLYTKQAVALMIAVSLPLIWNIIYMFDLGMLPRKDLTPVMFAASGIAIAVGLWRFRLFTTIPFTSRFVFKQLKEGILIFNGYDCLVEANQIALQMLRLDESIVGKQLEDLLPLSPAFERISSQRSGYDELTLTISGETRYYELETAPMLDDLKHPVGWLAILHDVTSRRQTEEQYRLITEYTADVIYKLRIKDEKYLYVSPSIERLLGYTEQEALNLKPKDVLTQESYQKQYLELMKDIESNTPYRTLELDAVHKDGHIVPIEVSGSLIYDENGEPEEIVGVARDITERRKMEEQLIMQDRLASIGQLSSGMAHEINNPLTGVVTFSALLLQRELPEDIKEDLQVIHEQAQRTAKIVQNLLTFARKQPQEKQPTVINEGIRKILELRAYEQKVNNIQVDARLAPDLPEVFGNSFQLEQVFFNIIINAEFFMLAANGKGVLTIATEKVGDFVRASFTDDGPGISEENIRFLFNPFFTTKEVGKGTGLGLSICHGIITEHGGRIWAESELGKGTTFIIELPIYNRLKQEADQNLP
jgi:PAS domain S-box-containing protein